MRLIEWDFRPTLIETFPLIETVHFLLDEGEPCEDLDKVTKRACKVCPHKIEHLVYSCAILNQQYIVNEVEQIFECTRYKIPKEKR